MNATTSTLWSEKFEQLAARWAKEPHGEDEPGFSGPELVSRVRSRLRIIQNYNRVTSRLAISSKRHWDQSWNPEAVERDLRAAARRLGWSVYISPKGQPSPLELAAAGVDSNTILLDMVTAGQRAAALRDAGLPRRWEKEQAVLQMLAEEIYTLTAERIGNLPAYAVVEEAALALFVQESLGLPFNPWALRFVKDS
ncbi:hypothetical protein GC173_11940 [bacterium]|nr:hypothetical protein [bacterium]